VIAAHKAQAHAGPGQREEHHRRGLRQGRRGQSTTAANLALALARRPRGAFDADIYGPARASCSASPRAPARRSGSEVVRADRGPWRRSHVDGVPDRRQHADGLAGRWSPAPCCSW
jgi:hypothetical protein